MRRPFLLALLALVACAAPQAQTRDPSWPDWPAQQALEQEACPPGTTLHREGLQQTCQDAWATPHGPFRLLDAQGRVLRAGAWHKGRPAQLWQFWDAEGQLTALKTFDAQGRLHGPVRQWNPDRSLHTDLIYQEGRPWEGFTTSPGPEGNPVRHTYQSGKRLPLAPLPAQM